jgi:hypothetical protein
MTQEILVFVNPETKEEVKSLNIITNKTNAEIELLLVNKGNMSARNIVFHSCEGIKIISPKRFPEAIHGKTEKKIVFQVDTTLNRQIPLDIEYSYLETVFT